MQITQDLTNDLIKTLAAVNLTYEGSNMTLVNDCLFLKGALIAASREEDAARRGDEEALKR